jgi:hypothetical protein
LDPNHQVLRSLTGSLAGEVAVDGPSFLKGEQLTWLFHPCKVSHSCLADVITSMRR